MKSIQVKEYGGPEALEVVEIERPSPGSGEVLVRLEAVGVNFIDTYQRSGQYRVELPFTPGNEGAGVVEEVGAGVRELRVGDRVAYCSVGRSYSEFVVAAEDKVVRLPDEVDARTGAAVMLQGLTAQYLVTSTFPVREGETCLVHAAAGGVGLLLVQMAKRRGARVIGTVSTDEKAALAKGAGADEVVVYSRDSFVDEVRRLTDGAGVDVVYDSVGRDTFAGSLDCLQKRGFLVLFGQSSGPVEGFDPQVLNAKGSLYLTRPSLWHYLRTREELVSRASDVLGLVASGALSVRVDSALPLDGAQEAHRRLEARETKGKVLLVP